MSPVVKPVMTPVRIKLLAFAVVSVLALGYGLTELFQVQRLVRPPDVVRVVFADPEGVYPRADVDLLGVNVGRVREVEPGPGSASTVVLEIDAGARVPADVRAVASAKSAIGEQYVQLVPQSEGGALLEDGDLIGLERTTSPPDLAALLGSIDRLVTSVPPGAVRTGLREASAALAGLSPQLRRTLDAADTLSASALANVDDLTALIGDAQTVLDTQVALGDATSSAAASLAPLTTELRRLDPTFDEVFVRGIRAGTQVTGLLRDNQAALPVLLNNLISLTDLGVTNLPGIRKSLVVFPWALEYNSQGLRYCDDIDPLTGQPAPGTCHYDADGLPIWSAHIANVISLRGGGTYDPCRSGYEDTVRHQPDGRPADGAGPRQRPNSPPNSEAGCTAPPTHPTTPNVRGFQNIPVPGRPVARVAPGWGTAMLNAESGTLVTPDGLSVQLTSTTRPVPLDGSADLGWLLTTNLTD